MKKFLAVLPVLFLLILNFTGCNVVGEKNGSPAFIYMAAAALSLALLVGCIYCVRTRRFWFITLFSSVLGVNIGYTLLSVSTSLEMALWANRLSYLGSVFLPLSMLMILLMVTNTAYKKWLPKVLCSVSALVFLIAASPGILPIYYKEVSFVVVNGVATLVKVYGPLHPLYLVYLLAYFAAMVACIIQSIRRKVIASQRHAVLLAGIVLGNLAVWLVEKFIPWDFEFLSVSYLFSEMILLGLYWMMQDYIRLDLVPQPLLQPQRGEPVDLAAMPAEEKIRKVLASLAPGEMLTARERQILELILENRRRKEIAEALCLSENTIKTYTRTLYGKLGVSSREELYGLLHM